MDLINIHTYTVYNANNIIHKTMFFINQLIFNIMDHRLQIITTRDDETNKIEDRVSSKLYMLTYIIKFGVGLSIDLQDLGTFCIN